MDKHQIGASLLKALRLLDEGQPVAYTVWVEVLVSGFGWSERKAKDVVSILTQAGYAESGTAEESGLGGNKGRDRTLTHRGRVFYRVSDHGRWLLAQPTKKERILHFAHRLYTTNPSPRMRRRQQALDRQPGGRRDSLRKLEGNPPLHPPNVLVIERDQDEEPRRPTSILLDVVYSSGLISPPDPPKESFGAADAQVRQQKQEFKRRLELLLTVARERRG